MSIDHNTYKMDIGRLTILPIFSLLVISNMVGVYADVKALEPVRAIKSALEIAKIRTACRLVGSGMNAAPGAGRARAGIESTRREVPKDECVRRGGDDHQGQGLSGEWAGSVRARAVGLARLSRAGALRGRAADRLAAGRDGYGSGPFTATRVLSAELALPDPMAPTPQTLEEPGIGPTALILASQVEPKDALK